MSGTHFDFEEKSTFQHIHSIAQSIVLSEGKFPVASLAGGGEGSGWPGGGRHVGLLHVEVHLNALLANHLKIVLLTKVCFGSCTPLSTQG